MIIYEGDLFMEDYKRYTLGAGILTVSIIQLVLYGFSLLGLVPILLMKDQFSSIVGEEAMAALSGPTLIISIVLIVILVLGIILILAKKSLGVYIFFTCMIINILYSIIMNGFKISTLGSLILPGLMAFFIYKKKHLYFGDKDGNLNTYN